MTTWADLLADLRSDLMDTSATPRWPDDMLYLYTKDGIRDYSTWFPMRKDRVVLDPQIETYPLPVNFIREISVECPQDTYLEKILPLPTKKRVPQKTLFGYAIQGGKVYLNASTGQTVYLTYLAVHPVPANKDDKTFVLTVPDSDVELIRLYVKAKVYSQMRSRQSALDRFKNGAGSRDDNPLQPEVQDLMADYLRGIAQRMEGGVIMLYRLNR